MDQTNGDTALQARIQAPQGHPTRYTGQVLLSCRPKTYRKVVSLLAEPNWSINAISQTCKVSEHTINAIAKRESASIEERKRELTHLVTDIAHIGAARVADTIGKASCRDAVIGTGVAIDKALALLGQTPAVQIANVILPGPEERAERRALHDKLDEIARALKEPPCSDST